MKKLVVSLLITGMIFMLAACGEQNTESDSFVQTEDKVEDKKEEKQEEKQIKSGMPAYGGSKSECFYGVSVLPEKDYVTVGYTESWDIEGLDRQNFREGVIAKFDSENNLVWHTNYNEKDYTTLWDVDCYDGTIYVVGYEELKPGDYSAIIAKYDENGKLIWNKEYGKTKDNSFNTVACTKDGGVVAAGYLCCHETEGITINGNAHDAIIVKFDGDGNLVWQYNFGGSYKDVFTDLTILEDGSLVAVGKCYSQDMNGITNMGTSEDATSDAIVMKFDENGNLLWQKNYGGDADDEFRSVALASNGDLVVAGTTQSGNIEGFENETFTAGYLCRLDKDGNMLWQKGYGTGTDDGYGFYCVAVSENDDIYLGGYELTNSTLTVVVRYDAQGNMVERIPYPEGENELRDIVALPNGYMAVGCCTNQMEGVEGYHNWLDAVRIIKYNN